MHLSQDSLNSPETLAGINMEAHYGVHKKTAIVLYLLYEAISFFHASPLRFRDIGKRTHATCPKYLAFLSLTAVNDWRRAYITAIITPYNSPSASYCLSLTSRCPPQQPVLRHFLAYALLLSGSPVCKKLHRSLNMTSAS